jgi:cysteine desulfurase
MHKIYLDYAAATPLDSKVKEAMEPYLAEKFYNPSATYLAAKAVHGDIEEARGRVAHWFGARPSEIIFTAGGTEANNLAIQGVMQAFPGKQVIVSSIEHESVLAPARRYKSKEATVNPDGTIDLAALEKLITNQTVLLSIMYANNEIGTIQPIREISRLLQKIRKSRKADGNDLPIYLHTDAAQASQYLDLHAARLGADLITINGGKIYGPKQTGALYIKTGVKFQPQILGGGQERGARSGTENVAGAVGLAAALDLVQGRRHEEAERVRILRDQLMELVEASIPGVVINGSRVRRLPNNVHITIPGVDNERLLMALDDKGIMCAAGSACSASKEESSHVLRAIGKTDNQAYSSLRLSLGRMTKSADIIKAAEVLASLVE